MSSTTVHVEGISADTTEREVRDFFSFCGKISDIKVEESSSEAGGSKSATVTFEKETAAKTALLLDNTQLGASQVTVKSAGSSGGASSGQSKSADDESADVSQEDKPRARIIAEYLAHGYVISDNVIERALALDKQHGVSQRFTAALNNFDQRYKATDKAKEADEKYAVTQKATNAWNGLNSYFEQALNTPTGQKLRQFYAQGEKQVLDVHNEARHLADLKKDKAGVAGASSSSEEKPSGEGAASGTASELPAADKAVSEKTSA